MVEKQVQKKDFANFLFFKVGSIAGYFYASIAILELLYGLYIWITESLTSFLMFEIMCFVWFSVLGFYALFITDLLIIVFLVFRKQLKPKEISKGKKIIDISMFVFYLVISIGLKLLILFSILFPTEFTNFVEYLGNMLGQFAYNETWFELMNCQNGCKLPQH